MQVGLFSYHADGTAAGSAFGTAERLESTVFASGSLCQLGAGYRDLPAMAAHAWKFTGRVVSANAESAVVQLEWQRVMSEGAAVSEAPTSVELTLKAGDRVSARLRGAANRARLFGDQRRLRSAIHGALSRAHAPVCADSQGRRHWHGKSRSWRRSRSRRRSRIRRRSRSRRQVRSRRIFGGGGGGTVYGSRVIGVQGQNLDPESLKVELWLVRSVAGMERSDGVPDTDLYARGGDVRVRAGISEDTGRSRRRPGHRIVLDSGRPSGGPSRSSLTSRRLSYSSDDRPAARSPTGGGGSLAGSCGRCLGRMMCCHSNCRR